MRRHAGWLVAAAVAATAFLTPSLAVAQRSPVLTEQPEPDGTPVPRRHDGRADLTGVWNKAIHQNTSAPVEPLPFTAEGLAAFNDPGARNGASGAHFRGSAGPQVPGNGTTIASA
jgi:hypothetical protein